MSFPFSSASHTTGDGTKALVDRLLVVLYICASGQHPYATEQDPDAEGEEVEEVAATSAAPAGFHPIEEWHHQKGRQSWDTFRAATALREENEPDEKVKKECRKYLQLSLDFSVRP